MNRCKKDLLVDTHKVSTHTSPSLCDLNSPQWDFGYYCPLVALSQVHLLCLIANGMFRNRVCSEPDLLAITLSLLPSHFGVVAKQRIDQNYLSGLLKWWAAHILSISSNLSLLICRNHDCIFYLHFSFSPLF